MAPVVGTWAWPVPKVPRKKFDHKGKVKRATMIAMFIVKAAVRLLVALTQNYVLRMAGVIEHSSSVSKEVKNFFFGSCSHEFLAKKRNY